MPYKDTCLKNNFQFKAIFPRRLRATAGIIENCLIENENILDIFLHENLEETPPPPLF